MSALSGARGLFVFMIDGENVTNLIFTAAVRFVYPFMMSAQVNKESRMRNMNFAGRAAWKLTGSIILTVVGIGFPAYQSPDLGPAGLFPVDNYWHWDVSKLAVHPNSAN